MHEAQHGALRQREHGIRGRVHIDRKVDFKEAAPHRCVRLVDILNIGEAQRASSALTRSWLKGGIIVELP